MITSERIVELATACSIHTIRHIEKKTDYTVVCTQQAKINGEWVDGICYYSTRDGKNYWRSVNDFNGFNEVKRTNA